LLKRHWALCVLAVGGTLLNIEMLTGPAASSHEGRSSPNARSAADRIASAARSYGLYPDPSAWSDIPSKVVFSERETSLLTILALGFIATLPPRKARE
jgi:hypothetical protein